MLNPKRTRAFSLVEFMVASFLIVVVLVASATALDASLRSRAVAGARDASVDVSYSALNKLRLLNCDTATGEPRKRDADIEQARNCTAAFYDCDLASGTSLAVSASARQNTQCLNLKNAISSSPSPAPALLATSSGVLPGTAAEPAPTSYLPVLTRERDYQATVGSYWTNAVGNPCPAVGTNAELDRTRYAPALINYQLDMRWQARNLPVSNRSFAVSETVSPSPVNRGLLVVAPAGSPVTVTFSRVTGGTVSTGTPVTRTSLTPTEQVLDPVTGVADPTDLNNQACAWFPLFDPSTSLKSGEVFRWSINGTTRSGTLSAAQPVDKVTLAAPVLLP